MNEIDTTIPGARWQFDDGVTAVFDNMLARSIPQYEAMRELSTALAVEFATDNTWIVDLGCSRGEAIKRILPYRGARNRYLGVEVSEPMLAAARQSLAGYIDTGIVELRSLDLREKYPAMTASVTLAIFTLQFIPIEYRQKVVRSIYSSLAPGGVLIVAEKVLGASSSMNAVLTRHYLDLKRRNGYTPDQIESKRRSLEGVLVPLTAEWNEELFRDAGFERVECFWRYLNFAGWLCQK